MTLELPLVVVDVQRGGPSTGLPTKTEQSDLLQAMFGRNGEAPVPVIAPRSAVGLLRRGARGGPDRADLPHAGVPALRRLPGQRLRAVAAAGRGRRCPTCAVEFATEPNGDRTARASCPYLRDPETLARPWAIPGTPGLEHRIGGIEKADGTGDISYDPANHDFMVRTRQAKIDGIAVPPTGGRRPGRRRAGRWCSAGARPTGRSARPAGGSAGAGRSVAQAHLRHLNPLPANLGEVLRALRPGGHARR